MSAWLVRLHLHDERILHAMIVRRRRYPDVVMNAITHLGDASTTIGLTLLLLSGLLPALRSAGAQAAIALVASHLGVQLLKRTISRERPRLPVGYDSLVHAPDRFSFPSGHAAAALSVGLPLAMVLPPVAGGGVVALSGLVGVSRCYLGVHYPGDVCAGWILALSGFFLALVLL